MGWRLGKGTHENNPSVPEQTTAHSQEHEGCLVFIRHAGFPGRGILSQQTTSSEGTLSACTFSTTPVTLTENIPSKPSVLHIWKRISSDQCNSSPSERICIKSYLDMSTNCKALYKTPLCDKKSKWPLSSLLYRTCSILSLSLSQAFICPPKELGLLSVASTDPHRSRWWASFWKEFLTFSKS